MHHAFVVEAGKEEGITRTRAWVAEHVGCDVEMVLLQHGLLSVEDARRVVGVAGQTSAEASHRVIVITADRAYHEAQNALLKLFEEPGEGVILFLCLPSLGALLPTLRSRVQVLESEDNQQKADSTSENAVAFLKATKEKRSALIKKLASGKDDDERRERREEAIALLSGIEQIAHQAMRQKHSRELQDLLSDISAFRAHLYDRSAPVKMILEHLSIVVPKDLV